MSLVLIRPCSLGERCNLCDGSSPETCTWKLGAIGESCSHVCSRSGLSCTDGDWGVNDVASFRTALRAAGGDPEFLCRGAPGFHAFGCLEGEGPSAAPYVEQWYTGTERVDDSKTCTANCGGYRYSRCSAIEQQFSRRSCDDLGPCFDSTDKRRLCRCH